MAQPVPPAPAAPSADEQFVVSGQLKKRKDRLGRHMVNHYVLHEKIGRGQHGTVYRASDEYKDSRLVAIKIVARNNPRAEKFKALRQNRSPLPRDGTHVPLTARIGSTENKIRKEIAIMKKCKNAHIVRLLEVIDDKTNRKIYMVMEYMGGGEVKWRDNNENPILTVDQTRRIIRDVVLGIEYLHYNGIIHRDIKPANLLWSTDRQRVKIADFGVSHFSYAQSLGAAHKSSKKRGKQKQAATGEDREKRLLDPDDIVLLNDTDLSKTAGTPFFLAPEIIVDLVGEGGPEDLRPPPKREIGKAIDIWALGVTLYCLLFGHPPWVARDAPSTEFVTYGLIVHKDWQPKTYMGLDRVPTGGRYPVAPPVRTRSGKEVPQAEGPLVMRLLDSLLQKDAKERIVLSEVKRYPWFLRDIPDAEVWLRATAPTKHAKLFVTDEDTKASLSPLHFVWDRTQRTLRNFASRTSIRHRVPSDKQHPESSGAPVQRQRSLKKFLPAGPVPGPSKEKTSGKENARPPHKRQGSSPEFSRHHEKRPSIEVPGTPRAGSRRGSDALNPPSPSPAGTLASGTTSPASPYHQTSSKARSSIASLFQLFHIGSNKASPSGSSIGTTAVTSAAASRAPSAMHSPTEQSSPPQTASPPSTTFQRVGSASALSPRFSADTPQGAALLQWYRAHAGQRPSGAPAGRRVFSYGVGGGQLAAEMRASSWGEPQDYSVYIEEHAHAQDVTSVHSGPELDEEVLLYGAGGVADGPVYASPIQTYTPSAPVSPGHTPVTELAAALPASVPPALLPALVEGESVSIPAIADPALQETGFISRVGSGTGRPHLSSPLALSAPASSEEMRFSPGLEDEGEDSEEWTSSSEEGVLSASGHYTGDSYQDNSSGTLGDGLGGRDYRASTQASFDDDSFVEQAEIVVGSPRSNIYEDAVSDDDESDEPVEIRRKDRRGSMALSASPPMRSFESGR